MVPVDNESFEYVKDGKSIEGKAVCEICWSGEDSVQIWCPAPCTNIFGRRCLENNLILGGTARCPNCGIKPIVPSAHGSGPKLWWLGILDPECGKTPVDPAQQDSRPSFRWWLVTARAIAKEQSFEKRQRKLRKSERSRTEHST
jgi:hypothetical protein